MNSKFEEILNLLGSLSFTSFSIGGDVENTENSLRNQTMSLTEFDNSFNAYCNGVRDMEENICSVFSKISGITAGISQIRDMFIISENGQVDKNKVIQLMLKNPSGLTNEEKELLSYVEKVLGEEKYARLKEAAINGDKNQKIEALMNSNKDIFISAGDGSANQLLAYQQDILNLKNSKNPLEVAKNFGKYLWDRWPGLWGQINEQNALNMGMDPQWAKLTGDFSSTLFLEGFTTVTINGIRAYKNISTGEIIYIMAILLLVVE